MKPEEDFSAVRQSAPQRATWVQKTPLLMLVALLCACSGKPHVIHHSPTFSGQGENPLYITHHGWHTGIVVPAKALKSRLPELTRQFSEAAYIEFGWGDQQFYQADTVTSGLTLRAALWPTPSVVHVVALPEDVRGFFPVSQVTHLCLTDSELASLVEFIAASFAENGGGNPVPLGAGIYGNSQFYQGAGDYHLTNNCNHWTAKGLKSIGMELAPGSKFTAHSILGYLKNTEQAQTDRPLCSHAGLTPHTRHRRP